MSDVRIVSSGVAAERGRPVNQRSRGNPLMRALLGRTRRPRLSVLTFHRVLLQRDPLRPTEPTAGEFEARMRWVQAHFNVLSLGEAVAGLATGRLPERPLAITFDDGYADNHDVALPILRTLGLPATFFVASGFLDGGRMFNDTVVESVRAAQGDVLDLTEWGLGAHPIATTGERCSAIGRVLINARYLPPARREACVEAIAGSVGVTLPTNLMMTAVQVAALANAGMEIGGHTVGHPILAAIPIDEAAGEIREGRRQLEDIVGRRVRFFAYPSGWPRRDYTAAHVDLVRQLGFEGAVSSAWGVSEPGADLFQIPRFTPWDAPTWKFGLRLAQNLRRSAYDLA